MRLTGPLHRSGRGTRSSRPEAAGRQHRGRPEDNGLPSRRAEHGCGCGRFPSDDPAGAPRTRSSKSPGNGSGQALPMMSSAARSSAASVKPLLPRAVARVLLPAPGPPTGSIAISCICSKATCSSRSSMWLRHAEVSAIFKSGTAPSRATHPKLGVRRDRYAAFLPLHRNKLIAGPVAETRASKSGPNCALSPHFSPGPSRRPRGRGSCCSRVLGAGIGHGCALRFGAMGAGVGWWR